MTKRHTLLLTALPEERAAVERALRRQSWQRSSEQWLGSGGSVLSLVCTGPGEEAAALRAREALVSMSADALVGVGLCGALSPSLRTGSLVLGERVACATTEPYDLDADSATLDSPLPGAPEVSGLLVSATAVVNGVEDRRRLWRSLGSPPRAAVDLESYAWASAAIDHSVPWAMVRGVSDDAESPLPEAVLEAVDASGDIDRTQVLLSALRRPQQIPSLLRLGRLARQASDRAADFAVDWIGRGMETCG